MGEPLAVDITFHRDVVIDADDFVLRRQGGRDHALDVFYNATTQTVTLRAGAQLPGGWYQIIVKDAIVDTEDGIALDGELETVRSSLLPSGDGVPGGDSVIDFGVIGLRQSTDRRMIPMGAAKTPQRNQPGWAPF